jgi:hypothetical protein
VEAVPPGPLHAGTAAPSARAAAKSQSRDVTTDLAKKASAVPQRPCGI